MLSQALASEIYQQILKPYMGLVIPKGNTYKINHNAFCYFHNALEKLLCWPKNPHVHKKIHSGNLKTHNFLHKTHFGNLKTHIENKKMLYELEAPGYALEYPLQTWKLTMQTIMLFFYFLHAQTSFRTP